LEQIPISVQRALDKRKAAGTCIAAAAPLSLVRGKLRFNPPLALAGAETRHIPRQTKVGAIITVIGTTQHHAKLGPKRAKLTGGLTLASVHHCLCRPSLASLLAV